MTQIMKKKTCNVRLRMRKTMKDKEKEQGIKNVFEEIMTENCTNLKKETDIQVQEEQRVPNKMNPNRPTPRHIIIKMANLKVKREL